MIEIDDFEPTIIPYKYGDEDLAKIVERCINAIVTLNAAVRELQQIAKDQATAANEPTEKCYTPAELKEKYVQFYQFYNLPEHPTPLAVTFPSFIKWLEKQ